MPTGRRVGAGTRLESTLADADHDREVALFKVSRTYQQVADHFKMSKSSVHEAVQRAKDSARRPAGAEVIADELLKLDALEAAAWAVLRAHHIVVSDGRVMVDPRYDGPDNAEDPTQRVLLTDSKPVLMAIDRILKCAERRAKLLGLDAPTKQTITVISTDVTEQAIAELEAEIAERDRAEGRSTTGTAAIPAVPPGTAGC